ncbi:acyl-CoA carboxylase subunit epsilon [Streptomyces sp. NPDC017520]|uniref:acyl-CoA carboxylase subunit epsilon n=1 Tax=Streptomyces sp. NPDC017520 TaxID=3364998 RepID=UPI00378DC8E7
MRHTSDVDAPSSLFRIERGAPDAEELAALTAVLMSRAAAAGVEPDDLSRRHRATARWQRPERTAAYVAPHGWRSAAAHHRARTL